MLDANWLEIDDARWTSLLDVTRHDFYHLPAYVALCAEQEKGEPGALYVTDRGRTMLLPLIVRRIPGGGYDATSPYGYPGPLLSGTDDPRLLVEALQAGIRLLESRGIVSLFVRLHPLLNSDLPEDIGEVEYAGDTISIDLTLPKEEQWHLTRANHRLHINRAIRSGRVAAFDDEWVHANAFKSLYRQTMTRVAAAPYYLFNDAYFDGLRAALGERLRLCVVEIDGAVAAAALFVETCGIVQYHLSGSNPAFTREGLTKLIINFVRLWATDRGHRELHLGGGVDVVDDALLHFKSGFSPRSHPFYTLRIIINRPEYRKLVDARERGLTEAGGSDGAAWRERARSFFPEYRAPP